MPSKRQKKSKAPVVVTVVLLMLLAFLAYWFDFAGVQSAGLLQKVQQATLSRPADSPHDFLDLIAEHKEVNEDTVGWLYVPGTGIDDVVVCDFTDNNYYLRRDFLHDYDFNGVFYADRRSEFGNGAVSGLGMNTCIYGHAMTDNPAYDNYYIKFGELHNFRDEDFARDTPYIYFSTERENLRWEVIAVFFANRNLVPFNRNDLEPREIYRVVTEEILPRSIYTYDAAISRSDKFLTLSTCVYYLPDGTYTHYPDTHMRYSVVARLVRSGEEIKETAQFGVNNNPVTDPDPFPN